MTVAFFDDDTERRLLANDPTLTSLSLDSSDVVHLPNYSYRVGQALGRSTHLSHLDLDVNLFRDDVAHLENGDGTTNTAFQQAMEYVMLRPSLESLRLCSSGFDEHYTSQTSVAAGLLLRAVNMRIEEGLEAVKSVSFDCLMLEAESMVALFQNGGVQEFALDYCLLFPGPFGTEENAIRQVARSLASCTTLAQLWLGAFNANVALVCALLEEDDFKGKIDLLALKNIGNDESGMRLATALSKFLRTSPDPLDNLVLQDFSWTGQSFTPISETVSTAQTSLHLGGGSMDIDTLALLRSMYPPDGGAKMLSLFLDIQLPDANEYKTLTEFIGSTPGLTDLNLRVNDLNETMQRPQLVAITRGLKSTSCAIQTLKVTGRLLDSLCEVFVNALPQFCSVEKLEMDRLPDHWNVELMEGFRKNRSLKEVSIEGLDALDRTRLDVYLQRNKELPTVIQLEALAFSSQSSKADKSDGAAVASSKGVASTTTSTTTTGKLLPPLFQASMDSAVPVGVSHLVGGLLCADENLGQRLASKRINSSSF